jgi:hypothetical protein
VGNRVLRKVYGQITEKRVWIIRANKELKELYNTRDLAAEIKKRNLNGLNKND